MAISLIVLLLAHGNSRDLQKQKGDKCRAHIARRKCREWRQSETDLDGACEKDSGRRGGDARPKSTLAKVVWVSAVCFMVNTLARGVSCCRQTYLVLHKPLVRNCSSCSFWCFSRIHWDFCRSAITSKANPPANRDKPKMSVNFRLGRAAYTAGGIELTAMTGIKHKDTHMAWAVKATMNLGGDFLISSKRESLPSFKMRWNRYEPTAGVALIVYSDARSGNWKTHAELPRWWQHR
jgi:hypothetical protein